MPTTSQPLITLITAVRNAEATLGRTLASIEAQTYKNIEYIVMDGASTDGTLDILARYKHLITQLHSAPDKGAADATDRAFRMASGDIVGLICADDWLAPNALEHIARQYQEHPDARMYCFSVQDYTSADGAPYRRFTDPGSEYFTLRDALYCQGLNRFYHRDIIRDHGFYDYDSFPTLVDRDFYIRVALDAKPVKKACSSDVLYHFLIHAGSNTTGGDVKKTARMLAETVDMGEHYLLREGLSKEQRAQLRDWICFNFVRLIPWRIKAGQPLLALRETVYAVSHYPLGIIKRLFNHKLPSAYRGQVLS